jgi:glycosyltransferase involved in cell wall biosynthesis
VFFNIVHMLPAFSSARVGVLVVLFPIFEPLHSWPLNDPAEGPLDLKRRVRNASYRWAWRQRLTSYTRVVSISEFTRKWTREYWGVDSDILYPPVDVSFQRRSRQRRILSVGRFQTIGHQKKHALMIEALGALPNLRETGWTLECVGAVGPSDADQAYLRSIQTLASSAGALVTTNLDRSDLVERYRTSQIFVHAAGYGESANEPRLAEHFGIATVEAMAGGCVPVVFKAGGQPEIVEHGVSGFIWSTPAELQSHVERVAGDDALRARLSAAARERAQRFSRERFTADVRNLVGDGHA